jgi:hypothetical protein
MNGTTCSIKIASKCPSACASGPERVAEALLAGIGEQVERVRDCRLAGQERAQTLGKRRRQLGQREAFARGAVGREHPRTAGVGEQQRALADARGEAPEALARDEQLAQSRDANDAARRAQRIQGGGVERLATSVPPDRAGAGKRAPADQPTTGFSLATARATDRKRSRSPNDST